MPDAGTRKGTRIKVRPTIRRGSVKVNRKDLDFEHIVSVQVVNLDRNGSNKADFIPVKSCNHIPREWNNRIFLRLRSIPNACLNCVRREVEKVVMKVSK
ncbi:hypothetical protein NPIL_409871 [Nephila pilipes]|uniref:Uncharacterized protein n=1 Tax=Nephila pilipes TaxID=299642 RepID=A0A8X6MFX5_NEPPI|nr:hypothetical protein NPIL_409871 [Nephila pilipes]